ncbi:alpha-hydroxy acid oxidase [Undibacterium pigrum]|uniref:L-lactate dehydrogenase (Cytochrome)/(S)-mandelate dehydrogenase n=1 Tax=Undibacterium pigrum TaxID=401470 RepID=A0A318IJK4_9BURK|nr:alpha-hydroxy acid oxidase [Undibacterium pigrum]PXX33692.1 L-lactate dehydrogenase (cytochrome)/(S)-mandelate dehydrogenase [Undibacterium pigrum]
MFTPRVSSFYSVDDFHHAARRRLPPFVYDVVAGGASHELALRRNIKAFNDIVIVPRIGLDTSVITTEVTFFGVKYAAPFGIAPLGLCGLVHPNGDILLAKAAAKFRIPYVASTTASISVEKIADACGVAPWFQLYASKSAELTYQLIDRVERLGCPVLIVTVDTAAAGRRLRDLHNGLTLPFHLNARHLVQAASSPIWGIRRLLAGNVRFPNIEDASQKGKKLPFADLMAMQTGGILDWTVLRQVRQRWSGIMLLKGVLSPADAVFAESIGVDGLILSNHGGRQLDCAPAPISVLPDIVSTNLRKKFLAVDSGVRSGGDVVKALVRGADMAFFGRAFLFALAAGGEKCIDQLINILLEETRNTMALSGILSADAKSRSNFGDTEK